MKISRLGWTAYGLALFIIVADQISKAMILSAMPGPPTPLLDGFRIAEVLPPVFNLTFVLNTGVSFGMFGGGEARWVLSAFSIIVAVALGIWALRAKGPLLACAIGLVIGGAIGNVIDRIRFGGVVDFIDFSGTGVFPWIFNIADSGITIGVMLLILDSLIGERRSKVGDAREKS